MVLPQWSGPFVNAENVMALPLPAPVREWAWGSATGRGVKVAVIDSGVEADHPRIGGISGAVAIEGDPSSTSGYRVVDAPSEDLYGHGTACASIIRALAPDSEIYSVRVLGPTLRGQGGAFVEGIRWAVRTGMELANLSLSSNSQQWFGPLHDAADDAYYQRCLLVCAANNLPGPTYPSEYASVVSVATRPGRDPYGLSYNPRPPVEFGARGLEVDVAWRDGKSMVATGNSFAAAHVTGMAALILSKHRGLTPFQVKAVLHAVAENAHVGGFQ